MVQGFTWPDTVSETEPLFSLIPPPPPSPPPKPSVYFILKYLEAGWRNQPQSFFTWKLWSWTSHWNHLEFLISISGLRNVLQSQEVFLMDAKSIFFNFEDREECYTYNFVYFVRQNHWFTQIHSLTSSMDQEGSRSFFIRNINDPEIFCVIYKCCISNCRYFFW